MGARERICTILISIFRQAPEAFSDSIQSNNMTTTTMIVSGTAFAATSSNSMFSRPMSRLRKQFLWLRKIQDLAPPQL